MRLCRKFQQRSRKKSIKNNTLWIFLAPVQWRFDQIESRFVEFKTGAGKRDVIVLTKIWVISNAKEQTKIITLTGKRLFMKYTDRTVQKYQTFDRNIGGPE